MPAKQQLLSSSETNLILNYYFSDPPWKFTLFTAFSFSSFHLDVEPHLLLIFSIIILKPFLYNLTPLCTSLTNLWYKLFSLSFHFHTFFPYSVNSVTLISNTLIIILPKTTSNPHLLSQVSLMLQVAYLILVSSQKSPRTLNKVLTVKKRIQQ